MSIFLCSCDRDDIIDDGDNGGSSGNKLKSGQVEIKVYPDNENKVSFLVTAKKITIDWGDGTIDELMPNGIEKAYSHEYLNQNLYTIHVHTETMTSFSLSGSKGDCHELRFGDCPALESISCNVHNLTVLDIKKAHSLKTIYCDGNKLTSLDVSGCVALERLDCRHNQLTSLNASGCVALGYLECGNNQLTSLDLSGCIALKSLYCSRNQLASLNVSGCIALGHLKCDNNQLTSLNISDCVALKLLDCYNNQLTTEVFNALFEALPVATGSYDIYNWVIYIGGNPGYESCDTSIAENKGWNVAYYSYWW